MRAAIFVLAILFTCLTWFEAHASSTPVKPPALGPQTCGALPGTKTGQWCIWRSTCPKVVGTLAYGTGLGEKVTAPSDASTLLVPAHTEFKTMASDKCLDLLTFSWADPATQMLPSYMIRPPGTLALTPPSPAWPEVNTALDYLMTTLKLQRPIIGYGQSEGGFNLSTIADLKTKFFDMLLLTHPVMGDYPNHAACPPGVVICNTYQILVSGNFWPSEWLIANPVAWIATVKTMPPLYVMACPQDEYGLFDGPKAFCDTARSRGFPCIFEASPPGCKHTDSPSAKAMAWASP